MERDNRQEALGKLLGMTTSKGYITFDIIMGCADDYNLSLPEFDWLSRELSSRNIIIYDQEPNRYEIDEDEEISDFAQVDYESTYSEIVALCPSLEEFIDEVRRLRPPQFRETSKLKYLVKEGNNHARQRMIEMHLRIALRIALMRAKLYDADLEETIGAACIGLINAVDKYDPDTSGPFSSFASMWIFQNVTREQSTQNPLVYFPVHKKEDYFSVYPLLQSKGLLELNDVEHCQEAIDLVCEKLGCSSDQLGDIWKAVIPFQSLDAMIQESENKGTAIEALTDSSSIPFEEQVIEKIDREAASRLVNMIISTLKPREADVIRARFGMIDGREQTLEEIGQRFNVTRERIRQIEAKALRRLMHPSRIIRFASMVDQQHKSNNDDQNTQSSQRRSTRKEKPMPDVVVSPNANCNSAIEHVVDDGYTESEQRQVTLFDEDGEQIVDFTETTANQNDGSVVSAESFARWLLSRGIEQITIDELIKSLNRCNEFTGQSGLCQDLYEVSSPTDAWIALYTITNSKAFKLFDPRSASCIARFASLYIDYVHDAFITHKENGDEGKNERVSEITEKSDSTADSSKTTILNALEAEGLAYDDRRSKGGCLWVFGDLSIMSTIDRLGRLYDMHFRFKASGPSKSNRPAWWAVTNSK